MIKENMQMDRICNNFINHVMDFYDIPGLSVGVYVGGDEPGYCFNGAGGFRNYETKDVLEPETVFHCTSVSKLFTAIGIMKLAEQGKLQLTDRLCDILPWMSIADKRWEDITISSMLTHTSGLTDVNDYRWSEHKTDENALREYALSEEVAGRKLLWEPYTVSAGAGEPSHTERFRYSSMAYDLLGLVIAEVSGVSFEVFMDREIFKPLGMVDTTFKTFDRIDGTLTYDLISEEERCRTVLAALDKEGLAMPHSKGRDRVIRIEEVYPYTRQHAPSSTLTSTAGDILKWASALMKSAPLHETRADAQSTPLHEIGDMWQPRVEVPDTGERMGLGWFIREQKVERADGKIHEYELVGHEGSDDGFRTSFWMCPELKIASVLLCNLTDAPLKKLNKKLFEEIIKAGM